MSSWLRVEGGNDASIELLPDTETGLRIAIGRIQTANSFDVQLNQPGLTIEANQRYTLNFRGRSDRPRIIFVGCAKAHAPWTGLGLYKEIQLKPEWQSFEEQFEAIASDENARIHFDVGGSDISVELSSVSFGGMPALQFLDHVPLPPRTAQPASHEPSEIGGLQARAAAAPNLVQFGALRRLTPISRDWGWDRGLPIDRYYIENFLSHHKADIRGRVLEVGNNSYTRKFGDDRVATSDVLHVAEGNAQATLVADLASASHVPSNTFDCMILTQTLQLIYDVRAAIKTIYRILKPRGVLLATFPGISPTYDSNWADSWYWSFTPLSARRLFGDVFVTENVEIQAFGNVFAAISFLQGLAFEDVTKEELDYRDPGYDVTLAIRAVKSDVAP